MKHIFQPSEEEESLDGIHYDTSIRRELGIRTNLEIKRSTRKSWQTIWKRISPQILALGLVASVTTAAASGFTIREEPGQLVILDREVLVATYAYQDTTVKRPYFANVKAPNGMQVTRLWPPREGLDPMDHDTMHPGIWQGFGRINNADFWRNKAWIRHERFIETTTADDNIVRFVVENHFEHQGQTICIEHGAREIRRHDEGYLFIFDSKFLAVERTDFGDQQEMGLGVRLATPIIVRGGNGRILNSEGHVNESQAWGKRARWADYSGVIDGHRTGVLLMPDPRNFRPSRFHSRDYGFTVANPFADKDFVGGKANHTIIGPGKRLTLRCAALVYSRPNEQALDATAVYEKHLTALGIPTAPSGTPWRRHTIDSESRGADGIRVGDINGDGLPDLTTGWEEGGQVRVYLNPGHTRAAQPWPRVVVGRVPSPEDAVFIDVNGDGRLDVVSSTEGKEKTVYIHIAPTESDSLLRSEAWMTKAFPALQGKAQWMFALPLQIDAEYGLDLVLGAKGDKAQVGWLQSPFDPMRLSDWKWNKLMNAGWIMSLRAEDLDSDGDHDLVLSDRTHAEAGVWWLENPGAESALSKDWRKHPIAGLSREVMFLAMGDINGDRLNDIVTAVREDDLVVALRKTGRPPAWETRSIPMPRGTGTGKGVAIADVDLNGEADLVVTCENANDAIGVFWLQPTPEGRWHASDISGAKEGVKFDRIELLDLDGDGDLDVLTCEENHNLGVIWYENPTR